ncbi:receptor activity-modifying protein 3 [Eucyclogobius newberryi]|uniref:receptor activity-modifying protein 3 n=1 Tax=Eucyclogobius newberryi TaxID=166745 RepID=UPI003B5914BD
MAPSWDKGAPLSRLRLYVLATLLLTGFVMSQSSNYTELMFNPNNQTVTTVDHGTNLTLIDKDLHQLQMDSNATLITEDDEAFQDWENTLRPGQCPQEMLSKLSHGLCGEEFYTKMMSVSEDKWCSLEEIIRAYHEMTQCLEIWSNIVGCFYPNPVVQDLFLQIHSHFFRNCSKDDLDFMDAPPALVLTLTLLPVSLIPALVYLVIWKNKARE